MRILIIEDDANASTLIAKSLRKQGFVCDNTDTAEDGIQLIKFNSYDAVVLDMMLPDISGKEVIRRLRTSKNHTPIIVLSALDSVAEKVNALVNGADDYILKPISAPELVARLRAVIRRKMGYASSVIKVGRLEIDLQTKIVTVDGMILSLTSKEYSILEILMMKKGHVLSKNIILNHLYDETSDVPSAKIIDVLTCKLRNKLKKALGNNDHDYIQTSWGRGHMMVDPELNEEKFSSNSFSQSKVSKIQG